MPNQDSQCVHLLNFIPSLSLLLGLDSFSDWLKSRPSRDKQTSPSQQRPRTSSPDPTYSPSRDRLLHSEVRELQSKVTTLERENHELRQQLAKLEGVDPSRIRTGRQVRG